MTYPDIYFEPAYARLYETADSRAEEYRFECPYGTITNLFLKRKIDIPLGDGRQYYDLITPYGYGGPLIHAETDRERLMDAYLTDFQAYCDRNGIVSEFVRFHPIIGNGRDFQQAYHSVLDRKTVGTNLTYADVVAEEFSKHKRKDIRKALENPALHYEVIEEPDSLDAFLSCYYPTMDRDGAEDYYYFDRAYFQRILDSFREHVIAGKVFLGDELIAMGVYFRYGKLLHAHLSGTKTEYLDYAPAAVLKYALALYGHDRGYTYIHYGGGTSNSPENGLYRFKKEFGRHTDFDFYIAKKIWNPGIYRRLCEARGADPAGCFFPAYREAKRT